MKINIYQINPERDERHVMFMGFDTLDKLQGNPDSKIYDKIFSGEVACEGLEDVFAMFNNNHPLEFAGRSLSVSDVVEVIDEQCKFYFCDTKGFREITFEPSRVNDVYNNDYIKVLFIEPNKSPRVVHIPDTLDAMQRLVGGYIEHFKPYKDEISIVCNDEGKMNKLPLNRAIYDEDTKEMIEIIAGNFFIAYAPADSSDFENLPENLIEKYSQMFKFPERIFRVNGEIKAIKF